MLRNNFLAKSVRFALISGAATAALTVFAAERKADDVERIEVTGSRLQRTNNVTTSPVLAISGEEIAATGTTRIEDYLNDQPQIFASQNSTIANGSTGTATVDLRGLGSARTLVLINGRRIPAGTVGGSSAADLNSIPTNLIKRVEILTGGSSATYGADAVGGVVNFILKDDFEGVQFDYQYSFAQHSNDNKVMQELVKSSGFDVANGRSVDGNTSDFSMILGGNFDNDKGNVTAYATYRDIQAIRQSERDYSGCALSGNNASDFKCGGSSTLPSGRFTDFAGGFDYTVKGNEFVDRDGLLYNYGPLNYFQRPDERKNFGVLGKYELNDHAEIYTELMMMDDRTVAQIAPSGNFFATSSLNCGNPLLSAQQFEAICGKKGLTADDDATVFIGRRNVEGGPRQDDLRHTQYRSVIGIRGDINDDWSYDAFANYGTTAYLQTYRNDMSNSRIARSLDVVKDKNGNAVCKSFVDGSDINCVPWNIFKEGGVTQEAINYLTLPLYARGDTESSQISALIRGDFTDKGLMIPGTSSGLLLLAGAEYRDESMTFEPDDGFKSGDGAGQGGETAAISGGYNVADVFMEVELPIIEDKAFAEYVSLEGAYRYSDYSTGNNTDTYKLGLNWKTNDSIRFRVSQQQAVRVPNIGELFASQSLQLFNWAEDPCSGSTPIYTLDECQKTGVTAGQYGSIPANESGQYNQFSGGNPDLKPETSTTFSAGVVLTPYFIDNFSLALDFFDIEIKDAVGSIGPDEIVRLCAKGINDTLCDLINRRSDSGDLWVGSDSNSGHVVSTTINTGSFSTSGLDFDANYTYETTAGDFRFGLIGSYLDTYEYESYTGADLTKCAGKWDRSDCGAPSPKLRSVLATTWSTNWDIDIVARWRYSASTDELVKDGETGTEFGSTNYLDLSSNWQVTDSANVQFGIQNVLDKEPQRIGNAPAGEGNGNTFPGIVDALGRYVYMGVRMNF